MFNGSNRIGPSFLFNRNYTAVVPPVVYEPETTDYLTAIGIANNSTIYNAGTPQEITGSAIWTAYNNFIISVKNVFRLSLGISSLSNIFYAMYPMIGGTASTHKFNAINPVDTDAAYRLTFAGGLTHSATGITPNGINGYARTFFNQYIVQGNSSTVNKDNATLGYYSRTNTSGTGVLIGCFDGSVSYRLTPNIGGIEYSQIGTGISSGSPPSRTDRLLIVTRNGSSGGNSSCIRYRDGSQYTSTSIPTTSISNANREIYLFAQNSTVGIDNYSSLECAFGFISLGMSALEVSGFTTAVQNLQSDLFRNV